MPLDFDKPAFPMLAMEKISLDIQNMDPAIVVKMRRVDSRDASLSVGIFSDAWEPNIDSHEMRGGSFLGQHEATLNRYKVTVQGLVVDTEEERGLARHYVLANALRQSLAWSQSLAVGLSQLRTSEVGSFQESLQKWRSTDQKFYSAEFGTNKWGYMSVLNIIFETETWRLE